MSAPPTCDTLAAALAWHEAGASVVPVALDGTKRPGLEWKRCQHERAGRDQIHAWFGDGHPGLGVVCGAISGGLEMLEMEGHAVTDGTLDRFVHALTESGAAGLMTRISSGYTELSPSGGVHWLYRVDGDPLGNTKLARRPDPDQAAGNQKPRVVHPLIETRGEGGYTVVAPSHGPVHPTGQPWRCVHGGPEHVAVITADQRDQLHAVARSLDDMPVPAPIPDPTPLAASRTDGAQPPGADYTARATWDEVLTPAGWAVVHCVGDKTYWRRPGKRHGISAVTGGGGHDYLWCWSTSTELPAEEALSKWRAYTLIHHGGDFTASAKALAARGYGTRPTRPPATRPVLTVLPGFGTTTATAPQPDPVPAAQPATTLAHTEDALALGLVDRHGAVIRHCADRGRWLHWTGHTWAPCPVGGGSVRELARDQARGLADDDPAAARFKQRMLSAMGVTNVLTMAHTDPRIVVSAADLDAHPYELNTPGGTVDLTTGQLQPHDPAKLHTRVTAATPDPDADPGPWLSFLADTFGDHPEIPAYLQRLAGYSATGVIRDHVMPFCYGLGGNGKTVFLETIQKVLGGYAIPAPSGFLMAKPYAGHETEIARLAGARMVLCSEVGERDRWDEVKVKQLTGGDTLTARYMRQDHFSFRPSHHLWLMGNHQPRVDSGGEAFWRRVRLIPFTRTVPEDQRNPDLADTFVHQHGAAILAWIVAGAVAYLRDGLDEPDSVRAATADYAADQDTVAGFLDDCCHLGGGTGIVTRTTLVVAAYQRWCLAEGVTAVSAKTLGMTLRHRGVGVRKSNGAKFYIGLALTGDATPGGWANPHGDGAPS